MTYSKFLYNFDMDVKIKMVVSLQALASMSVEEEYLKKELLEDINQFLADLPETERKVFMYRYWNLDSIERISKRYGYSTSKVTSMLYRIRGKFRKFLETEEYL